MTTTPEFFGYLPDNPVSPDQAVGERIAMIMRRQRMTQKTLADLLGLTQTSVSRKLLGERPWTLTELGRVAVVLNVEPAVLVQHIDWIVKHQETWVDRYGIRDSNPEPAD